MCTGPSQLQPHDPLEGACTPREPDQARVDDAYRAEQDGDAPFDPWTDLGGEA